MGEVTREEFRRLRGEVRETRDLTQAILLALVGRDKALTWKIESCVERQLDSEKAGAPLREIVGHAAADRIYGEFEVGSVRALRRIHRHEVEALAGVGPVVMSKLDSALSAENVEWGDWV